MHKEEEKIDSNSINFEVLKVNSKFNFLPLTITVGLAFLDLESSLKVCPFKANSSFG